MAITAQRHAIVAIESQLRERIDRSYVVCMNIAVVPAQTTTAPALSEYLASPFSVFSTLTKAHD
jgi:orotate phosphoribosyltransferase